MNSNTIGIVVLILMLIAGALVAVRCDNTVEAGQHVTTSVTSPGCGGDWRGSVRFLVTGTATDQAAPTDNLAPRGAAKMPTTFREPARYSWCRCYSTASGLVTTTHEHERRGGFFSPRLMMDTRRARVARLPGADAAAPIEHHLSSDPRHRS